MSKALGQWVFGYGSLIWKQDFPVLATRPGAITGWVRRFWQGSHDHRGLPDDPGRVVTVIASPDERCEGIALRVAPDVFGHLDDREKNGYERVPVVIELDDGVAEGVMYRAPEDNHAFLGPAPLEVIVDQINRCAGPSGSNRDYALELARALRALGFADSHVFDIESRLLALPTP